MAPESAEALVGPRASPAPQVLALAAPLPCVPGFLAVGSNVVLGLAPALSDFCLHSLALQNGILRAPPPRLWVGDVSCRVCRVACAFSRDLQVFST